MCQWEVGYGRRVRGAFDRGAFQTVITFKLCFIKDQKVLVWLRAAWHTWRLHSLLLKHGFFLFVWFFWSIIKISSKIWNWEMTNRSIANWRTRGKLSIFCCSLSWSKFEIAKPNFTKIQTTFDMPCRSYHKGTHTWLLPWHRNARLWCLVSSGRRCQFVAHLTV